MRMHEQYLLAAAPHFVLGFSIQCDQLSIRLQATLRRRGRVPSSAVAVQRISGVRSARQEDLRQAGANLEGVPGDGRHGWPPCSRARSLQTASRVQLRSTMQRIPTVRLMCLL